jgi:NADH-quinone oxidoreductase subunit G
MAKDVTLTIDGREITVAEGTLIVNAARQFGIDIPVFCYHPKMEPVGMCRMCLVEIGRPVIDRATGQPVREANGAPKIQFGPKLETACTTPVSEGMVVVQNSDKVKTARKDVVEFILTSHPLDCPICDKGGECPLQNLTMAFGPGQSRFLFDEKMHLQKHLPLGELIYLDRERCIQCGRCVRFQTDLAGDPVIGFYQRGRSIEIATFSEPGFDSYFSGNTTDICPVGALTTADFRFGARPWELNAAASICPHCPVGCNLTINTRREARSSGREVIKRIMPRQNEAVNETWICDKGRLGYHFAESAQRLTQPLVRQNGQLVPADWETALAQVAAAAKTAGARMTVLAGGRLANEDLFNLKQLTAHQGGQALLYTSMGGGDLVAQAGVAPGSNLANLGKGSTILVIASDLEEEAPIWSLRVRQAARRGATLIVANPRATKLDKFASQTVRYAYGEEGQVVERILRESSPAEIRSAQDAVLAQPDSLFSALAASANLVIFFGSEGLGLEGSQALAQVCARMLTETGHAGRPNNGLIGVWPGANSQGAWDAGFRPAAGLADQLAQSRLVLIAAADPAGDDPALAKALDQAFVVVQELFMTKTAALADVVLPAQSFAEREGTNTSGERRVQRFYPVIAPLAGTCADYAITSALAKQLDLELEGSSPARVFEQLASQTPGYASLSYQSLAETVPQWPIMDREDLYYGGTSYNNVQGLGVQLARVGGDSLTQTSPREPPLRAEGEEKNQTLPQTIPPGEGLLAVPVTRLYDRGQTLLPSTLLGQRLAPCSLCLNPADAARLGLAADMQVQVRLGGESYSAGIMLDEKVPSGVALAPRSVGLPVTRPVRIDIQRSLP